jgi:hypothetical protein
MTATFEGGRLMISSVLKGIKEFRIDIGEVLLGDGVKLF